MEILRVKFYLFIIFCCGTERNYREHIFAREQREGLYRWLSVIITNDRRMIKLQLFMLGMCIWKAGGHEWTSQRKKGKPVRRGGKWSELISNMIEMHLEDNSQLLGYSYYDNLEIPLPEQISEKEKEKKNPQLLEISSFLNKWSKKVTAPIKYSMGEISKNSLTRDFLTISH